MSSQGQFLHVGFDWTATPKTKELEGVFSEAIDWVRYAPNCWILWTPISPAGWYERLKPHLGHGDGLFICALEVKQRSGWLPKWVWEWLDKPREFR